MSFNAKTTEHVGHIGSASVRRCNYVEFASESARLNSFDNGRVGEGQSAQALASAGFFYFGTNVRCSRCVVIRS